MLLSGLYLNSTNGPETLYGLWKGKSIFWLKTTAKTNEATKNKACPAVDWRK